MEEQLKKDNEILQKQLDDLKAESASKDAQLKTKQEEVDKYKKAEEEAKFNALKTSIENEVKEIVKMGKIVPAREKALVDVLCTLSEDARKDMIQTFKESGKIEQLDEHGRVNSEKTQEFKDGDGKFEFDGKVYDLNTMSVEEVNQLAESYSEKNELGWSESMDVIYAKARPNS